MTESGPGTRSPFGKLLIDFRTAAGLSQNQLATRVNIATRSIAGYEAAQASVNAFRLPHLHNLNTLASALALSNDDHTRFRKAYERTLALRRGTVPERGQAGFLTEGREEHIQAMERAWQRAKAGTPQVVLISGDSDIGKSSLIRHVCDEIGSNESEVMFAWGEASSWATNAEPYMVFRRALDHLMGAPMMSTGAPGRYLSRPTLQPDHIYRVMKAWPALNDVLVSANTMRDVIMLAPHQRHAELLELLETTSTSNADQRLQELTSLLVDLAQSWPIVLVLEDLQWAGTLTCQLFAHLVQRLAEIRNCPILIVATYRHHDLHDTEDGHPHPLLQALEESGSLPPVTRIDMNTTLASEPGKAFVRALVLRSDTKPDDANSLAEWIFAQSSGHPLISQELLAHAMLHGKGTVVPLERAFDSTTATGSMIRQRLRHISPTGKRVLDIASVMGEAILPATIAALLHTELDQVVSVVEDELIAQQGLLRVGPSLAADPPVTTFAFVHTLFQDYLYRNLPADRRGRLHSQIAGHLEAVLDHGDPGALGIIARHLVLAEDWHGAVAILHSRAQLYSARLDWDLAQSDLDIAEEYAHRTGDPFQLWLIRSNRLAMLRSQGEYDEALKLAERILEHLSWNSWPMVEAATNHHLGEIYYDLSRLEEAVQHLLAAADQYLEQNEPNMAGAAEAMLSHTTMRQGLYDIARQHALRALQHVRQIRKTWVKPEALLALANCDIELGFYERAMEGYREAGEMGRMIGKLPNQVIPMLNTALCLIQLKRNQDALDLLDDVMERLRVRSVARHVGPARLYAGYAYEKLGNLAEAKKAYQEALDARLTNPNDPRIADCRAGLLRVALAHGQAEKTRACLQELEEGIEQNGTDGIEELALVQITRARASLELGDAERYACLIREAYATMMGRADKLVDVEARRSYLESVPVNRELRAHYSRLEA